MKCKSAILAFVFVLFSFVARAQFKEVYNYALAQTPTYGVKIKTNLPFPNDQYFPTVILEGFAYGWGQPVGLILNFYNYQNAFYWPATNISSFGAYTPKVILAVENGKVVIFVDDKCYFGRFSIRASVHGAPLTYLDDWTVADEPIANGALQLEVAYKNKFAGNVSVDGKLGVGITDTKGYLLAVGGKMIAEKVVVKNQVNWPDYVFDQGYSLPKLDTLETFINTHKHLPGVTSAKEVKEKGLDVEQGQAQLLQKIEELTLYIIAQNKKLEAQEERLKKLEEKK
jgi:hypothetical protein